VKPKIFFVVAFALAHVCPAQTPTPSAPESHWQLSPPFDVGSTPSLVGPTTPVASSPAPRASTSATRAQTTPVQSSSQRPRVESIPGQAMRERSKASYVEGSVWVMTFVKTKSGLSDEYLKSIAGSLKPIYEEEKKQKIIFDYKILTGDSAGDSDFNFIIMVEYPNMAALEGSRERTDPIIDKIMGSTDQRRDIAAKRLDLREILATKTMREIWLK
jgi:hypothetical protein